MALSNVRFKGFKALQVMADTLPAKMNKKLARKAFKYSLQPTKKAMKDNVKIKSGRLWHSIDTTVSGNEIQSGAYAIVGPRRKRFSWNQQGWAANLVEGGTKPHTIKAGPGKLMPIFTKAGFTGEFAKSIEHKGSKAKKPFRRAIDSTWKNVNNRFVDKTSELMRNEIKMVFQKYGTVYTKYGDAL